MPGLRAQAHLRAVVLPEQVRRSCLPTCHLCLPAASHRLPQADIRNVNFTLPPSGQCSEKQVAQQAQFVQQQTGNLSAVWAEGLTLHVASNTANLPVLSGTTGKQGETHASQGGYVGWVSGWVTAWASRRQAGSASSSAGKGAAAAAASHKSIAIPLARRAVGTMLLHSEGTNSTCTQPAGSGSEAPAAASATGSDSEGGGTPGWVWAIVGVAAAAALAAVAGALLWRRRRRSRRAGQDGKAAVDEEAGADSLGNQSSGGGPHPGASTSAPISAQTGDGTLESHGSGEGKADSLWKAR